MSKQVTVSGVDCRYYVQNNESFLYRDVSTRSRYDSREGRYCTERKLTFG